MPSQGTALLSASGEGHLQRLRGVPVRVERPDGRRPALPRGEVDRRVDVALDEIAAAHPALDQHLLDALGVLLRDHPVDGPAVRLLEGLDAAEGPLAEDAVDRGGDAEPAERALQIADVLALRALGEGTGAEAEDVLVLALGRGRGGAGGAATATSASATTAHANDLGLPIPIGSPNWCTAAELRIPASWVGTPTTSLSRVIKVKLPDDSELELDRRRNRRRRRRRDRPWPGQGRAGDQGRRRPARSLRSIAGWREHRDRHGQEPRGAGADPP